MSSPPKEKLDTRAGHPPAVKAGGMRIVQKHQSAGDAAVDRKEDKDSKEFESCSYLCNYSFDTPRMWIIPDRPYSHNQPAFMPSMSHPAQLTDSRTTCMQTVTTTVLNTTSTSPKTATVSSQTVME
ncbi:hypothetical protein NFI96_026840 [Prochilodus magdalenae]|nr:hypothetical protein NFI96_026840 [Prochilodus magdalenae]